MRYVTDLTRKLAFIVRLLSAGLVGSRTKPQQCELELIELEDRILLSATPLPQPADGATVADLDAAAQTQVAPELQSAAASLVGVPSAEQFAASTPTSDGPVAAAQQVRRELVFVDSGIVGYEQLLANLSGQSDADRLLEVVLLDADQDGIEQISQHLANHIDLDAVHIVSHGTERAVQLGNVWLDQQNLQRYAGAVSQWGDALSSDGDFVLYGCNLAATSEGRTLLEGLRALSGADIAASTDNTGHADRGGDWNFEYRLGTTESRVAFDQELQASWQGLMAVPTANDDTFSTVEGDSLAGNVLTNDTGTGPLSAELASGPSHASSFTLNADGTFSYTSTTPFYGVDSFTYRASNGSGYSNIATVTINVSANNAPALDLDGDDSSGLSGNMRLHYGEGTESGLRFREKTAGSWSAETTSTTAGSTISWVVSAISPTGREEMVLALSDTGTGTELDLLRYDGTAWTVDWTATRSINANAARQTFDLVYEANSGHALAVYGNGTANPVYRVWNGSTWSSETNVFATAPGAGEVLWVELASRPGSDEIALVYSDSADDLHTAIWDGTAWRESDTEATLETSLNAAGNYRAFDVAYENSGDLLVAWGVNGNVDFATKAASSTSWVGGAAFQLVDGVLSGVDMSAEPGGDRIAFAGISDNGTERLGLMTWNGTAWEHAGEYDSLFSHVGTDGFGEQWATVGWRGTSGEAIVVYSDRDSSAINWGSWTASGGWAIQSDATVAGMGLMRNAQLVSSPTANEITSVLADDTGKLWAATYDGTSWSVANGGSPLETNNSDDRTAAFSLGAVVRSGDYTTSFVEGGGPVNVTDSDATLSDANDATLASMTVTITNLLDGASELLAANVTGTNIATSYNSSTGVLSLSGADSKANYQQVLRTVTYNNSSQNPTTTTRHITILASDGTTNSNLATSSVSISAVDSAATLDLDSDNSSGATGADFSTSFTEDGGAVAIADADATLVDADSSTLASLTVTITNLLDGAAESLAANTTGTSITASYNSGSGVLTLSGVDTVASYQQVLRTVTYNNTSQTANSTDRSITFVANDGSADSNIGTATVTINAVDDAATLDLDADNSSGATGADFSTSFTEDGGAVAIADADATLADADSSTLASLTVTITNLLDGAAESLAANTTGTSITASYNSSSGVLTLSGVDTVASYQQVLRTVTYNNTSQNLTTTTRSITFVANDGSGDSNSGTATVTMNAVNDAVTLDLDSDNSSGATGADFSTSFTEDGGAVTIADADATLVDADSSTLNSLTVTLTNLLDGAAESLAANTSGTSITASYNSGSGVLTLSGVDTVANYQQVLRTVTYNNTSQNLTTTTRSITFVANDGSGDSNSGTATVTMNAVNDAATLDLDADNSSGATGAGFSTSFTEDGGAVTIADADATLVDADSSTLASLNVTLTNLLDGAAESLAANTTGTSITASYNSGSGVLTLSGVDTVASYQQVLRTVTYNNTSQTPNSTDRSIRFVANDGSADSNIGTATVTVTAVNDAPQGTADSFVVVEDNVLTVGPAGVLANDTDVEGDAISATLVSGTSRGQLSLNPDGSFTYAPAADFSGTDSFTYRVDDNSASSVPITVTIYVTAVNDAPVATDDYYRIYSNGTLRVSSPGLLRNDSDVDGDVLAATLVSGPSNGTLTLNPDGTLSYTPDLNFAGTDTFTYLISDGPTESNTATVSISVSAVTSPSPASPPAPPTDSQTQESSDSESDSSSDNEGESESTLGPAPTPPDPETTASRSGRHSAHTEPRNSQNLNNQQSQTNLRLSALAEADSERYGSARIAGRAGGERDNREAERRAHAALKTLQFSFDTGLLFTKLDSVQREQVDTSMDPLAAGTAAAVTSALSAGYVLWTIRGGYLLASMLSSTPAWRLVDPLPVLNEWGPLGATGGSDDTDDSLAALAGGKH